MLASQACFSVMYNLRKDVYNPKIVKYWVELKTSATMETSTRMEVRDSTTAETSGHVDSEGYAAMGEAFDMDDLSGGPLGDLPGSSDDPAPSAGGLSKASGGLPETNSQYKPQQIMGLSC